MTACFECGQPAEHDHHVVPRIRGGTKTVPLCGDCHGKAHHRDKRMSSSQLTKDGLARAKQKGVKLGSARPGHWDGREHIRQAAVEKAQVAAAASRRLIADQAYADLYEQVVARRKQGATFQDMANELNEQGKTTVKGKRWSPIQVLRVLRRAKRLNRSTENALTQMELFA